MYTYENDFITRVCDIPSLHIHVNVTPLPSKGI